MGFTYPDKFTHLDNFVIQLAQNCLDNGGPTVVGKWKNSNTNNLGDFVLHHSSSQGIDTKLCHH